jgi:hypothetical protein
VRGAMREQDDTIDLVAGVHRSKPRRVGKPTSSNSFKSY